MKVDFTSDPFELLFSYGLDLKNRVVYLHKEIDDDTAKYAIMGINYLSKLNLKPITLDINCVGGDSNVGVGIVNTIKGSPAKITGIVSGLCCSMAIPIIAVCDKRLSYPIAQYMIHQAEFGVDYTNRTVAKIELIQAEYIDKVLDDVLIAHTKITSEMIREIDCKNFYFNAEKALELGLIDKIITK